MHRFVWAAAVVAGMIAAPFPAKAGVVVNGGGSSGWQSVPSMGQSGPQYWANPSSDGSNANVGYFLNQSGYYASNYGGTSPAIAVSDLNSWGEASGAADTNLTFSATGAVKIDLLLTLAGDYGVNEFGWYKAGDPTSTVTLFKNGYDAGDGVQSLSFGNNAGYGTTPLSAIINPGGAFGFYISNGLGQTFYTESSLNTAGSFQAFALFRSLADPSGRVVYVGGEDRLNGDFDYNDITIRMTSVVPEPASLTLMALGGLGLLGLKRRYRKND